MAKSWSGFGPQNELVKLYWEALEASQSEKYRILKSFTPASDSSKTENSEDDAEAALLPGVIPAG